MTTRDVTEALTWMDADFRVRDVEDFLASRPDLTDATEAATEFCRAAARYEYPPTHQ